MLTAHQHREDLELVQNSSARHNATAPGGEGGRTRVRLDTPDAALRASAGAALGPGQRGTCGVSQRT